MDERLVDRIYEASFMPDLWPSILDSMAGIADARGGYLITAYPEVGRWTASDTMRDSMVRMVEGGWMGRGERFKRLYALQRPGLQNAVTALQLDHGKATRSFAVRSADSQAAMVAHVLPIRGASRDICLSCEGVLVLTPVGLPNAPPVELVMSLFDLTPAEAQVARSLTAGNTVDAIASASGVSRNTVRSHLRATLDKTGCSRQAELVALCSGLTRVA